MYYSQPCKESLNSMQESKTQLIIYFQRNLHVSLSIVILFCQLSQDTFCLYSIIFILNAYCCVLAHSSVPIKLIFVSKSAFLLGTCRFIFNFPIVKHAKTADHTLTH